jgi:hypothetical protein
MRRIHEREGVFREFFRGQFLEGGLGAQLRAAILVELAKRQS